MKTSIISIQVNQIIKQGISITDSATTKRPQRSIKSGIHKRIDSDFGGSGGNMRILFILSAIVPLLLSVQSQDGINMCNLLFTLD